MKTVLSFNDLHKRYKDVSSLIGSSKASLLVQQSISKYCRENNVDYLISGGDLYDKGFMDTTDLAMVALMYDIEMSESVNGNFYGLIGNHLYHQYDINPEVYIIQPSDIIRPSHKLDRTEPIMRTVPTIIIGGVQISLVHFNNVSDTPASYHTERLSGIHTHIAYYHTTTLIPNRNILSVGRVQHGNGDSIIAKALNGVDYAIMGDFHTPIPDSVIITESGSCLQIVPGSVANTTAKGIRPFVNLPIFTIKTMEEDGEDSVSLGKVEFSTYANTLTVREVDDTEKVKSLRSKGIQIVQNVKGSSVSSETSLKIGSTLTSYFKILNRGEDVNYIKALLNGSGVSEILNMWKDERNV